MYPTTNFIGKDPMQWWIGQVTDPDKGEWGDLLEKKQAEDGEDIYAFRCRVRIVGYHGSDSDLPDKDLPLAHVLLPPNTTTTGGCGATMQYQGGEVVVGFFFDGVDGQQPVIFGTLFKQPFISDKITSAQFNASNQTDFKPYTPPKVRQRSGKQRQAPSSPWGGGFSPGELVKTIAHKQKEASTNITFDNFTACEDNEISKISNTIKDFTRKMQTLQQLNEQNSYVDPIFGGIVDAQTEIKLTTNRIHNSMTKLIRRGRSWVIQETLDKLSTTLKDKTPKPLQAPAGQATNALIDTVFCNFEKIQDQLLGYLGKSLENMIGQVLDVPVCGVENFMSDMFGQMNNILDTSLGSMFEQLNNIQGGGIALPSATFTKAIKFANIITNVLDCDRQNCPENTTYSTKNGVSKAIADEFKTITDKMGLKAIGNPLLDSINDAIPAVPSRPDCNTNVLKCGPPRVDFIGGSGQGASGNAIVNALGNIIGVAINGTGFGFREPPLVSFFDSCDKGYGAGGFAKMGRVSPVRYTESDRQSDLLALSQLANTDGVNANQIQKIIPDGKQVGDIVFDNDENSVKITNVGLNVTGSNLPVYIADPNGTELGVVGVVMTAPGQEYLPNTTEEDLDGNIKEILPDPNANYDGAVSYVTTLDDVIVENTGFGYDDNDTASVEGGSVAVAGDTLPGDATSESISNLGQAQVELQIQDGLVVGANVKQGGFGFTKLPEVVINSDTGVGAKLSPVLKFTRIDDASQLADTDIPFDRNLPQDVVVTVISCIEK
tara:strand:- start:255 stop:2576 length:2322 start_codon:yes stop_codon:yes gene_type:complete